MCCAVVVMAAKDIASIEECPDCASTNIVKGTLREQVICRDCGLIFEPFVAAPAVKPAPGGVEKARAKPARKAKKPVRKRKK